METNEQQQAPDEKGAHINPSLPRSTSSLPHINISPSSDRPRTRDHRQTIHGTSPRPGDRRPHSIAGHDHMTQVTISGVGVSNDQNPDKKTHDQPKAGPSRQSNVVTEDAGSVVVVERPASSSSQINPDLISDTASQDRSICRICFQNDGQLLRACKCKGTMALVHNECLQDWIHAPREASDLRFVCEVCESPYNLIIHKPSVGRYFRRKCCPAISLKVTCYLLFLAIFAFILFIQVNAVYYTMSLCTWLKSTGNGTGNGELDPNRPDRFGENGLKTGPVPGSGLIDADYGDEPRPLFPNVFAADLEEHLAADSSLASPNQIQVRTHVNGERVSIEVLRPIVTSHNITLVNGTLTVVEEAEQPQNRRQRLNKLCELWPSLLCWALISHIPLLATAAFLIRICLTGPRKGYEGWAARNARIQINPLAEP